jgi:hypothetical protein
MSYYKLTYHEHVKLLIAKITRCRRKEKKGKRHRRMNRRYPRKKHRCTWYTTQKAKRNWHRRMNRWSIFQLCRMIGRRRAAEDSSTRWFYGVSGDTVGLSDAWFESRQRRAKTDSSAPDEPTPWSEEESVYPTVSKKPTETFWRQVLQHRMNRHTVNV